MMMLRLFTNDFDPTPQEDDISRFTEASGGGYAPIELDPADFALVEQNGGLVVQHGEVAFEFSDKLNHPLFGYYITSATGKVLGAVRFEATEDDSVPYVFRRRGDRLFITAGWTIR